MTNTPTFALVTGATDGIGKATARSRNRRIIVASASYRNGTPSSDRNSWS